LARRVCLICGGRLEKTQTDDKRWKSLQKKSYYVCERCGRQWLYSADLTCPVLLEGRARAVKA